MIFSQVKQAVPAADVLSHFLGRSQAHRFLCPFHPDKNPSMTAKDGGIICWSCGWSGDIFKFVQEHQGVSIGDALRICADLAGIVLPDRTPVDRDGRRLRLPSLARSHAHVLRESEKMSVEITVITRQCAADAWRRAWDARGSEAVWDAVAIGAALDHEVAIIEMGMPCEKSA